MSECLECGRAFEPVRKDAAFCDRTCRNRWNNRRLQRGAQLYDLFMRQRYERAEAAEEHTLTVLSNLARAFRDSDVARRNGRKSWDSKAAQRLPLAYGSGGDGR